VSKRSAEERIEYPEHPLFPLEEGAPSFDVAFISLARKENGSMVWIPRIFAASELTKTDQILELYGGGTYDLWARSESKLHVGQPGNITKKRILQIPGRPKLLDPTNATAAEEIAAGLRVSPMDAKPASGLGLGGDGGVLVAILQMGQQAAQAQAQQSQQFMALMMQMMSEGKKESAESMRMMMQMMTTMTQSQQQSMMQMLPLLVAGKGGGPQEIEQYLTLFQKLGFKTGAPEGKTDADSEASVSEVLSNVATIVSGAPAALSALREMAPGNGQVALPQGPPIEAAPGSAASVLNRG
jgi:hypothetical protein